MAKPRSQKFFTIRLSYDPETGEFVRLKSKRRDLVGAKAGSINENGYSQVTVEKRTYYGHRLAWLFHYGEWPTGEIDHIDGDRANNRIANLRVATRSQNLANRPVRKDCKSGHKGVYWSQDRRKWRAVIRVDGKVHHLGGYDTKEEAGKAYAAGALKYYGEFAHDPAVAAYPEIG